MKNNGLKIGHRVAIDCEAGPWPKTHEDFMADRTKKRETIRSYGSIVAFVDLKGTRYILVEFENGIKGEFENIGGMTFIDKILVHADNLILMVD